VKTRQSRLSLRRLDLGSSVVINDSMSKAYLHELHRNGVDVEDGSSAVETDAEAADVLVC